MCSSCVKSKALFTMLYSSIWENV